ncbi:MAG: hypothetical protein KIG51_00290, partial [Fibrobacter sp.]|nr:hypothetical protein [Fibrobacter sp.]
MKKIMIAICALAVLSFAGEGRSVYSPFASYGLEISVVKPLSDAWKSNRTAFGNVNFISNFQILPYTSVTGDIGYSFPGNGFDAKIGLQQQLLPTDIAPFVGGMAGVQAIPEDDFADSFEKRIGPTVEAN